VSKSNFLQTINPHLRLALILALLAGLALAVWQVQIGHAATDIHVTTFDDKINTDGFCSLREAIISANKDQVSSGSPGECAAGSGDTIFPPAGTYTLA
jgi:CSLREA domain-containing protein